MIQITAEIFSVMHSFGYLSWLVLSLAVLVVKAEVYCIGSCSNPRNLMYEELCCDPDNLGDVIRITGGEGNRDKYISCPSILSTACNKRIVGYSSCQEVLNNNSSAPSGFYNIIVTNGSTISLYCDMEGVNCDGEGGWTRIGYLNMTEPDATCPDGLEQNSYDDINHDLCGKTLPQEQCNSTFFETNSINYTKVCGQVRGYQYGHTDGFFILDPPATIDDYVAGVSITYYNENRQRQHIWTYVSGENQDQILEDDCPCNTGSSVIVPSFVGNDYYCESGHGTNLTNKLPAPFEILYPTDPLWDGEDCNYLESPCCTNPRLPWFVKALNETTNSDIELRICGNNENGEDVPIDIVEIFVK